MALCFSPIGDTIFATPAIRALRYNLPQAKIVILANQSAVEVFKDNPYQIEVLACADQWDLLKKLVEIRKHSFDLAVGLSQIGGFFTRFCGTPFRSDFISIEGKEWSGSVVQLCLEVIAQVGLAVNTYDTEFWVTDLQQRKADCFLAEVTDKLRKPLVAIHCGGHYFARKRWPVLSFIRLIAAIFEETAYQVMLVGGKEDLESAALIKSVIPEVIDATGRFSLGETAALLNRCRLLIANDSGPLHLGAAIGVPTIGLFGPTNPEQFFPYRHPLHRYIYKKISCSPCYRFRGGPWQYLPRCSKAYCMEAIKVEEVLCLVRDKALNGVNTLVEVTGDR